MLVLEFEGFYESVDESLSSDTMTPWLEAIKNDLLISLLVMFMMIKRE